MSIPCTYGLIGYPLGHSFSRDFFNRRFADDGSGCRYGNFELPELNKSVFLRLLNDNPVLTGLNVTAPYKIAVMPLLDCLDDLAVQAGAVNTIRIRRDGDGKVLRTEGFNTDVTGLAEALRPLLGQHHRAALILGTGGASRAAVAACRRLGIDCAVVSRTSGKADLTYTAIDSSIMRCFQVIINATPLGTWPKTDACAPIPYHLLNPDMVCFDMVYNPPETMFMRCARQAGATVANGLGMLHAQAIAALGIWEKVQ